MLNIYLTYEDPSTTLRMTIAGKFRYYKSLRGKLHGSILNTVVFPAQAES